MPEQPRLASRAFSTLDAVNGLPRLEAAGHERQTDSGYHRAIGERSGHHVTVQIGLAGHGALWERPGPWRGEFGWRDLPPGHALLFIVGEDQIAYGYPPGATAPWEFLWSNISGEGALAMARGLIVGRGRVLPLASSHAVVGELRRLTHRGNHSSITAEAGCRFAGILFSALAAGATNGCHDLVRRAMTLLDGAAGTGLSVAAVARRLGTSREHLTRMFTRSTGEPPAHWLAERRLARAALLLEDRRLPLAEVAAAAGFGSANLLIRHFGVRYGLTPGAYRRKLAGHN